MKIKVTVMEHKADNGLGMPVFRIAVETDKSHWQEFYGSKEQTDAFVRGVTCGAGMHNNFDVEVNHVKGGSFDLPGEN